jgi:hypothetical protein
MPFAGFVVAAEITLDALHAGTTVVTGHGDGGMGVITIYDTSYEMPAPIGSGEFIDASGFFAVSIHPPLEEGHSIQAESEFGDVSLELTVAPTPMPQTTDMTSEPDSTVLDDPNEAPSVSLGAIN